MSKVKILVVEDNLVVAEDIRQQLEKLGYEVTQIAESGEVAIAAMKNKPPDVVLLDIHLGDGMDGIGVAEIIRRMVDIPFIYVTAYSGGTIFERAKKTAPHAYIVKPFNFKNLHSAIELALSNFSGHVFGSPPGAPQPEVEAEGQYIINDAIFIKQGGNFEKVLLHDVTVIKAQGSYSVLHTEDRKFTISMNLHSALEKLSRPDFIRLHRSYVVNVRQIESVEPNGVIIKGTLIPMSKALRGELLGKLRSL